MSILNVNKIYWIGIQTVIFCLILLFCIEAKADIVDKVLPWDKDKILEPII